MGFDIEDLTRRGISAKPAVHLDSFVFWVRGRVPVIDTLGAADIFRSKDIKTIAVSAGDGIRAEGARRGIRQGRVEQQAQEFESVDIIEDLLGAACLAYTRESFFVYAVNKALRGRGSRETLENLKVPIGLLREVFGVRSPAGPLRWCGGTVWRVAHFPIDVIVDYARRDEELIFWEGFVSASRTRAAALEFAHATGANILLEIRLREPAACVKGFSEYEGEEEVVLTPYMCFRLGKMHWDSHIGLFSSRVTRVVLGVRRSQSWLPQRLRLDDY